MAITDNNDKDPYSESTTNTAGNETIYEVPAGHKVFYFAEPTVAGNCNLAFFPSRQPATITAHTGADYEFTSNISTRFSGEIAADAVAHIGLDVASGTWRFRVKFVRATE